MNGKSTSVEVYTETHRILGRIQAGPTGLFSYINIPTRSYIEMEGAHLSRLHQPSKLIARHPTLWLVKSEVVVLLLSNRSELGAASFARGGYTSKIPHWVRILMGGYEMRGMVETSGKFNFGSIMFEGDSLFIPIYHTDFNAILFPAVRTRSPVGLINRKMIDGIALLPKEEIPQPKDDAG